MTAMTPETTFLLVVRRNGSSSSRQQRRFRNETSLELGIQRARGQGFDTFWVFGPAVDGKRPKLREWSEGDDA